MKSQSPVRKLRRKRRVWRDQVLGWLLLLGIPLTIVLVIRFKSHLPAGVASWIKFVPLAWGAVVFVNCVILLGIHFHFRPPRKK